MDRMVRGRYPMYVILVCCSFSSIQRTKFPELTPQRVGALNDGLLLSEAAHKSGPILRFERHLRQHGLFHTVQGD